MNNSHQRLNLWPIECLQNRSFGRQKESRVIYVLGRGADNFKEPSDKSKAIICKISSWGFLAQISGLNNTLINIYLTSNHFAATFSASTAFLQAPRTLSTSSQHKNLFSRKYWRVEVISELLAGSPIRCLCHDLHAYCKA